MAKARNKDRNKSGKKVSKVKLTNKKNNKLAKRGKLKKKVKKVKTPDEQIQKNDLVEENLHDFDNNLDDDLSDQDLQYFSNPGQDSFMSSACNEYMNDPVLKQRNRKRKLSESEELQKFEEVPRKLHVNEDENAKHLLPIKTKKGVIAMKECLSETTSKLKSDSNINQNSDLDKNEKVSQAKNQEEVALPELASIDLFAMRRQQLREKKLLIANIASSVIENPEENIRKLKELRLLLLDKDADIMVTVKKLAAVSLMEIFKDIIPGYRIRLTSQSEKKQRMKKETKTIWEFEEALLTNYRHFLEYLEITIRGKLSVNNKKLKVNGTIVNEISTETRKSLRTTALNCLCELFVTHPHFNYRSNIISVIVPLMDKNDKEISKLTCNTVRRVFKEDRSGEVTLELVKSITKLIKTRHFKVHRLVLDTFLSLKIKEVNFDTKEKKLTGQERKNMMRKMSRKDKKKWKKKEQLEKDMLETRATEDINKKVKLQTETIQFVFLTYFRILKEAQNSKLLPSVLEGLAKYAHLINIDFFDDLFKVFSELISSDKLAFRESLHCIQTAFTILTGHGSALNIDPNAFYTHLYGTLSRVSSSSEQGDVILLADCLEKMLIQRKRHMSQQRVLAFVKRLTSVVVHLPHQLALSLLEVLRQLLLTHKCTELLFDNETQGSGVYLPEVSDPEHANAYNTSLWELLLLHKHYHPVVRQYFDNLHLMAPLSGQGQLPFDLARKTPASLAVEFCNSEGELFNPKVPEKCIVKSKVCLEAKANENMFMECAYKKLAKIS